MPSHDPEDNPASAHIVNCWNSIGVWGRERPRCPVLLEVIHCRNCEKYIAAGQRALQRPVPGEYVQEWTRLLARKKDTDTGAPSESYYFPGRRRMVFIAGQLFATSRGAARDS